MNDRQTTARAIAAHELRTIATLFLSISIVFCVCCQRTPEQHTPSPPVLNGEPITDPELYAKWVFGNFIQNDLVFVADLPGAAGEWRRRRWDPEYIEERKYKNVLVPVEELLPYIELLAASPLSNGTIEYELRLTEEGQQLVIDSKDYTVQGVYLTAIRNDHSIILRLEGDQILLEEVDWVGH